MTAAKAEKGQLLTKKGQRRKRLHPLTRRMADASLANLNRGQPVRTELTASQIEYLDWLTTPKGEREPATKEAEAAALGVSSQTLREWEKRPYFREAWDKALKEKHLQPEVQSVLMDRLLLIARNGSDRDAIAAIGMYQKIVGGMAPEEHKHVFDPRSMTDEEVARAAENVVALRREA